MKNISIIGAGNIGTQFAVHCAAKGFNVTIYTKNYEKISGKICIADENGEITKEGVISAATDNPEKAFENADIIFVTVPAFCFESVANEIEPYVKSGAYIGLIPGSGGGECAFKNFVTKGCILFGLQRVPSVARLVEYGRKVQAVGYRKNLYASSIPNKFTSDVCEILTNIFDIKCSPLPNYLNCTLIPSNPILHTTRLKTIFKDYKEGLVYDYIPLFYEEWENETSELLLKCDDEVQQICMKLKNFDLSYVKSLKEHYEAPNAQALTDKIKSIKAFKKIKTPSIELDNGKYIPDLNSRYFTSDFNFGLVILKQIALFLGINVPNMTNVLEWYSRIDQKHNKFDYKKYGIVNIDNFIEFYGQ